MIKFSETIFNGKATITVKAVPIRIKAAIFASLFEKFLSKQALIKALVIFIISSLKNKKTASKVPRCNIMSKTTSSLPPETKSLCVKYLYKLEVKTRCPELDTGKNSVKPCIKPIIIACIKFIFLSYNM